MLHYIVSYKRFGIYIGLTQRPCVRFSQSDGTRLAVEMIIRTESSS